ncbi:transmembrane channel-like protein 6b isoform X2 [Melanotaenia boesemani]|uniref:transmembrane channel-like protein 6b isoform X2 n=1 Tax=Melanotaenia boesemani TaxID=1250792 RepID=UPI001C047DA4|nr:transmembrane channel-like protein 6b isoform X2 [Melanotaenia boesemani]
MAQNVNFDLHHPLIEAGVESPADEEGVQDMFHQLIAEQSQNEGLHEAIELQQLQKELDEEGRDNVAYLSSPPHEFRRPYREQSDNEFEGNERPDDPLIAERWSSATLKILSSMPSRTIGRSRGAIISQYYNRTMQLRRRRQSRPAIRDFSHSARPSIRGYGMVADATDGEDTGLCKRDRLVNNLQNLSAGDRMRMLQEMPLSVAEKRDLRRSAIEKEKQTDLDRKLSCCYQLKYYIIIAVRHTWYSWLSFLHSLQLWQVTLKRVSGRFGSGVLSYFLFLKKLLFLNVFLFLVMGAFLVLPQAMHPPELLVKTRSFSGLELLTGAGYFSDTLMYYGYYSNYTLNRSSRDKAGGQNISVFNSTNLNCTSKHLSYNMPLAYFFTIGMAFFITCIILVYSMSKSFGQSFRIEKSDSILTKKVFCSWDFKVIRENSVKLMSENICTQLKELLAEVDQKHVTNTACQKLWRLMVHGLAWTICIAGITASVIAIFYFSDFIHQNLKQTPGAPQNSFLKKASLLALPLLVSLINLLLPGLFNLTAWMEEYESPSVRTYVSLGRNLLLKVSVLAILCYHWLGRVANEYESIGLECWESFVGEEFYRFLLMDFIFTLLYSLFGELLWRIFTEKVLKRRRKPEFDIAKNVLDLIYGQTLAWLGVLFSPLLPAVQTLKLLLLFYIKQSSVMMNCQSPRKPYRVSQMTTIFITLLCFPSFLGASVCVTYTMWSVKPSLTCGPFRELETMFQAGKRWMEELEQDNPKLSLLARAHTYLVEHPLFLFIGAGIFLIVIYFHSQVVDGQRKIISLLQEQIENEGEDKKFLITRLQQIHERKRTPAKRLTRQESAC